MKPNPINREMLTNTATSVAGGYARRFIEGAYDHLFETEAGRKLMALPGWQKHGLEFLLYLGKAAVEAKIQPGNPAMVVLKELLTDAPPEIARRLINGRRAGVGTFSVQGWSRRVMALPLEARTALLGWIRLQPEHRRAAARHWLAGLDDASLTAFALCPVEEQAALFELAALVAEPEAAQPADSTKAP